MSAKEFFSTIDLSKLDTATATQIREEILTLSQEDWDLMDNDSEMEKQIDVIKQRLEKEFPDSIGLKSIPEKVIDKKEESIAKAKEQAVIVGQKKEELAKKAEEELANKQSAIKDKSVQSEKLASDIEEMQMLIELTQDTVNENPTDEDLPLYLELLQDTLQNLSNEYKVFIAKKKDGGKISKTTFANGGLLVINDTDIISDNYITDLLVRLESEWGKDSDVYNSVEEVLVGYSKSDEDGDMYLNANGIKRINQELSEYDLSYRLTANGIVDVEELEEDTDDIYVYKFYEERGELKASVEDKTTGIVVWEYNYPDYSMPEEEREFATTMVDDGFIKNWSDTEGLENYLKSLDILPATAELITSEEAIQDYNYYANGGGIFSSGNHNTGRSWHLDRQKYNASEDWEKPLRKRKRKYKSGGLTDVKKKHEYRVMYSYKSKDGVTTDEFQDKDLAKAFYDKKILEEDIELVMMDYNEFNQYGKISSHKHLAAYSWKDKPMFDNGGGVGQKFKEGDFAFAKANRFDTRIKDESAKIPLFVSHWSKDKYYVLGDGSHYLSEDELTPATKKDFNDYYGENYSDKFTHILNDVEKTKVGTYVGKDAVKGNVIKYYKASNGTNIELVSSEDRDSSTGINWSVAINGRGLWSTSDRDKAYDFYEDLMAKSYRKKLSVSI